MVNQGAFGYIIGKKKRMMRVPCDADLLWQILVREIYVLMKHYGSKESLQTEFEKIKQVKIDSKPKPSDIEKCKFFIDSEVSSCDWNSLLKYCEKSFINILESGYIINHKEVDNPGTIFLLDFNKGCVSSYRKDINKKIQILETATVEEIMEFEGMPTRSYSEIVAEMKDRFTVWYEKYTELEEEIVKLNTSKTQAKKQGDANIEDKLDKLISDLEWEKREINRNRRVFYYRLKALDLIEDE